MSQLHTQSYCSSKYLDQKHSSFITINLKIIHFKSILDMQYAKLVTDFISLWKREQKGLIES